MIYKSILGAKAHTRSLRNLGLLPLRLTSAASRSLYDSSVGKVYLRSHSMRGTSAGEGEGEDG